MSKMTRLIKDASGATAIEYGLIVALVSLLIITGANGLGVTVTGTWNLVSTNLKNAAE